MCSIINENVCDCEYVCVVYLWMRVWVGVGSNAMRDWTNFELIVEFLPLTSQQP